MASQQLEAGQVVKFLEEEGWVYGVIERTNGKVAIVQWDDGTNTQIYVSRLEAAGKGR